MGQGSLFWTVVMNLWSPSHPTLWSVGMKGSGEEPGSRAIFLCPQPLSQTPGCLFACVVWLVVLLERA